MKLLTLLLALIALPAAPIASLHAQTERPTDVQSPPPSAQEDVPGDVRSYGGYLLDMSLMGLAEPQPVVRILDMPFPLARDYSRLFAPTESATYSVMPYSQVFSSSNRAAGGIRYYGPTTLYGSACISCGTTDLQMGSFSLGNGLRLQTYGQYDADGHRVYNPSALPWEKNRFHGAFELKSANGSWGFRVEVEHR